MRNIFKIKIKTSNWTYRYDNVLEVKRYDDSYIIERVDGVTVIPSNTVESIVANYY